MAPLYVSFAKLRPVRVAASCQNTYQATMTKSQTSPDSTVLSQFAVTAAQLVTRTPIAEIWKVARADGTPAALKIYYDGNMQDEAPGFDLLAAQNGQGAALIYDQTNDAVLMEWLDGPSLADLVRRGADDTASKALVDTANRLHQMPAVPIAGLDPLERRFTSLFDARFAHDCPASAVAALRRATALGHHLIASQSDKRPLHGDFHHENIKGSARGFLAFDAKGVFGDRHYELANAFWNPLDAKGYVRKRETIQRRSAIWAAGFETTQCKLIEWAAAYTALSLSWTYNRTFGPEVAEHIPYLETLLSCSDDL